MLTRFTPEGTIGRLLTKRRSHRNVFFETGEIQCSLDAYWWSQRSPVPLGACDMPRDRAIQNNKP
jgi:hypothetical protein